jgi:ABC-type glycerol-3-phosphate transport system substrate-binding protein
MIALCKKNRLSKIMMVVLLSLILVPALAMAKKSDEKQLIFWHWWADHQNFLVEMSERYRMDTGIKVKFELYSPTSQYYWQKIAAAAQAKRLPDIIGLTDNPELIARYAKAGRLVNLKSEIKEKEWNSMFTPRAVEALSFKKGNIYGIKKEGYWGVPFSVMSIQIYYNKDLFVKAGLDPESPPKTWKAFLEACQKLQAAGIPPVMAGFEDLWVAQTFFRAYAWSYLGEEGMRGLFSGKVEYTDERCEEILGLFQTLRDKDYFYPGVVSKSNKEAEILFSQNRAAMMINGSWAINVYSQMNPDLKYGVMNFPKPEAAEYPMVVIGGLGKGAAVTADSKKRKEAIAFLKWLTQLPQQERWARMPIPSGFPALIEAQKSAGPRFSGFIETTQNFAPNLGIEERQEVLEVLGKGMQSLLIGDKTISDLLWDVDQKKKSLKK